MRNGLQVHLIQQHRCDPDVIDLSTPSQLAVEHTKLTALGILHMVTIRKRPMRTHQLGRDDRVVYAPERGIRADIEAVSRYLDRKLARFLPR